MGKLEYTPSAMKLMSCAGSSAVKPRPRTLSSLMQASDLELGRLGVCEIGKPAVDTAHLISRVARQNRP